MPIIFNLFLIPFLISGFFAIGEILVKLFKLKKIILLISEPKYQYPTIGISFFLFIIYPFFLLGLLSKIFFVTISMLIIFIGFINIIKSRIIIYNQIYKFYFNINNQNYFQKYIGILVILYLLISLCLPTSGDSVSYHLYVSNYILKHGIFPSNHFYLDSSLAGSGELLNTFFISINIIQFSSFIHFLGLVSMLGILMNLVKINKLSSFNSSFLKLLILSSPVLIALISDAKPQFFYACITVIAYVFLFNFDKVKESKDLILIFIFSNILLLVAVSAKISFLLSFFIVNYFYLFFFLKKNNILKPTLILFCLSCIGLLPIVFYKSFIYDYPFYNFFFNPIPLNIPGYSDYYDFLKNSGSKEFPISFFLPLSLSQFTSTLGLGLLSIIFLIFLNFKNKLKFFTIILIFSFIQVIFGAKSPRFFLEIYILTIFFFANIMKFLENNFIFKCYKILIILQSFLIFVALLIGVFLIFPANFSINLKNKILTKHADGFSLYEWVNSVLPKNSTIIVDHRSISFSMDNIFINPSVLSNIKYEDQRELNYFLNEIKLLKPEYILYHGVTKRYNYGDFNFINCTTNLYRQKENVGFKATRNPFNNDYTGYGAYIYKFDYSKLPSCVKKN
jgi:hypothetical protein